MLLLINRYFTRNSKPQRNHQREWIMPDLLTNYQGLVPNIG